MFKSIFSAIGGSAKALREGGKNDYWWALFWLAIITIIFFLPVISGFQSLFEALPVVYKDHNLIPPQVRTPWVIDGGHHARVQVPISTMVSDLLRKGIFPLWNPYIGAGEVLIGMPGGFYDPIKILLFSLFSGLRVFDFYTILKFLIGGFGAFIFLKELGLKRRSSLFGAIAYMFSGYFVIYMNYWFLITDNLLPYILFAIERYLKIVRWRELSFIGLLFAASILMGGHPQVIFINIIVLVAYILFRVLSNSNFSPKRKWRCLIYLAAAFFAGFLISLPFISDIYSQIIQGITIPQANTLIKVPYSQEHLVPTQIFHFFVNPTTFLETVVGNKVAGSLPQIIPYTSIVIIVLMLLSFFITPKPRWIYFAYGLCAVVLLKLFGFPLFQWIAQLQFLREIGAHKLYGAMSLFFAAIAAFSFDSIFDKKTHINTRYFWVTIAIIAAFFVLVVIFAYNSFIETYATQFDFLNRRAEVINQTLNFLDKFPLGFKNFVWSFLTNEKFVVYFLFVRAAVFYAITLFLLWFIFRFRSFFSAGLLIFWMILELWIYMPKIRDGFRYFNPYVKPPFIEFLQSKASTDTFRIFPTDHTLPADVNIMFKLQEFQTSHGLYPKRLWFFLPDTIQKNMYLNTQISGYKVEELPARFFDAANVKFLITENPQTNPDSSFALVYDKDLKIYENTDVLPRAYLAFQKETANSPEQARERFYSENFDYRNSVILEDKNGIKLPITNYQLPITETKLISYKPNEVIILVNTEQDGILVLTDAYYNGWNAYIDGQKTEIYPANVLFRGIFVPKGSHTLQFSYQPAWFLPSLIISLLVIFISLIYILII